MTPTPSQNINTQNNTNASGFKKSKGSEDLSSGGFEALFANAMVGGQTLQNAKGLSEALTTQIDNKAKPLSVPPPSVTSMNGLASAVQAAVSPQNSPPAQPSASVARPAQAPAQPNKPAAASNTSKPSEQTAQPARPNSDNTTQKAAKQTESKQPEKASSSEQRADKAEEPSKPLKENAKANELKLQQDRKLTAKAGDEKLAAAKDKSSEPEITVKATDKPTSEKPMLATQDKGIASAATKSNTLAELKGRAEVQVETPSKTAQESGTKAPTGPEVKATAEQMAFNTKDKASGTHTDNTAQGANAADKSGKLDRAQQADFAPRDQRVDPNSRTQINAQASAAAQFESRTIQVGDKKLVTAGVENKGSTANNGLGIAAQPSLNGSSVTKTNIKTPVNQPGFARELGQKVNWAIGKNISTVDIKVNPDQMGTINMRIVQKGQTIQLMIRTQDEASGVQLQQTIAGLRETLSQSGLQLSQVQIQSGNSQNASNSSFGQNMQGQMQQEGGGNAGSGQSNNQSPQDNQGTQALDGTNRSVENEPKKSDPNSNLDLFA